MQTNDGDFSFFNPLLINDQQCVLFVPDKGHNTFVRTHVFTAEFIVDVEEVSALSSCCVGTNRHTAGR